MSATHFCIWYVDVSSQVSADQKSVGSTSGMHTSVETSQLLKVLSFLFVFTGMHFSNITQASASDVVLWTVLGGNLYDDIIFRLCNQIPKVKYHVTLYSKLRLYNILKCSQSNYSCCFMNYVRSIKLFITSKNPTVYIEYKNRMAWKCHK